MQFFPAASLNQHAAEFIAGEVCDPILKKQTEACR
jgi:hypothetical protein